MATWTDRYPHPGEAPPHPGPEPAPLQSPNLNFAHEINEWWRAQADWNAYVRRERLHRIARAVDFLIAKESKPFRAGGGLTPPEQISLVTGIMFLDGSTVLSR